MHEKVAKDDVKDTGREPKAFADKKSYKRPSLQVFGEVGVLTRGSTGSRGDQGTPLGKRPKP